MVEAGVERYLVDHLVHERAGVTVLLQRLSRVDVHWHDFYELVYVCDGTATHLLNGSGHPLHPGSMVLLTPADFHEFESTSRQPLTCYNVVVNPSVVERELEDLLPYGVSWAPGVLDDGATAEPDFRRLWHESSGGQLAAAPVMTALLRCILVEVARLRAGAGDGDGETNDAGAAPDDVRRAIRYVERHFREPITLSEVAAEARLSPNYLSERFRQVTGTPFQAYLQQLRLRFARSLLASTRLGVTEICHAAGFNSPSHFGRAYRRRYGETPSAARLRTV